MDNPQQGDDRLRSLQEIPEKYRSLFSSYPCFNRVQSAVFGDLMESTSSVVVTAPTGSGKTVLFELALVKLLMETPYPKDLKAVYVAPVKALCSERFQDWSPKLEPFGVSCIEVTGDSIDQFDLQDHQVILTTPEKWDSLTRRWRDNVGLVQLVKLMMIDEVHLLNDSKRGPTLETIVCRMKTVVHALKLQTALRFIAVSATIFNIEDLAQWLGSGRECARFHRFGNEMRPVALKRVVKGFPQAKGQTPFLFDIQLSYKLKPLLQEYAEGKPVLIFCSTRRGVVQTCKVLVEQLGFNFTQEQVEVLDDVAGQVSDGKLKEFVRGGVGYHHAGMTTQDRLLMQDTFMRGSLPVLVATTTLAMGVNLPAHLVIIKSTHQYMAGRIIEYPESSLLQMVGRAGRPQFDTSATAVIMTRNEWVRKYENLLDCKEVLESSLHLQLTEHLNSEIVLFTITDLAVAMDWLRCTFLYQRAFKNPKHYGFSSAAGNPGKIDKDLELMVLREINALQRAELVELSDNGVDVSPTANGRLMSHYYISFNTFNLFPEVSDITSMKDLLKLLSLANELGEVQLRVNERRLLNDLNISKQTSTIRFPVAGKVKTNDMKVNVLAQACLGCLPIPDPSLQQEAVRIVNSLERVAKCLTEYLTRKNSYCALLSASILGKCLHAKLWENSCFVARQLDRIGPTLGAALVACGKTSFEALTQSHPHELERIMNRGPPLGHTVIDQARHLPHYSLSVRVDRDSVLRCQVDVTVQITNADLLSERSTAGKHHAVILIVGDTQNRLLHFRRALDVSILSGGLHFRVAVGAPLPQKIFVHLISEQWVGIDTMRDILVNPMAPTVVGGSCYLPTLVIDVSPKKTPKKNKKADEKDVRPESEYWKRFKLTSTSAPLAVPKASPVKMSVDKTMAANYQPTSLATNYQPTSLATNYLPTSLAANYQPTSLATNYQPTSLPTPKLPPASVNLEDGCCFDLEPEWGDSEEGNLENIQKLECEKERNALVENMALLNEIDRKTPAENKLARHSQLNREDLGRQWERWNDTGVSNCENKRLSEEHLRQQSFSELNPQIRPSVPYYDEIHNEDFNCEQSFGDDTKPEYYFPNETENNFQWRPRVEEKKPSHEEEICGVFSGRFSSDVQCVNENDVVGVAPAKWQIAEIMEATTKPLIRNQEYDSHESTYNLMDTNEEENQLLDTFQDENIPIQRESPGADWIDVVPPPSPGGSQPMVLESLPKRVDENNPSPTFDDYRGYNPGVSTCIMKNTSDDSAVLQKVKELEPKKWTRRETVLQNLRDFHEEQQGGVARRLKGEVETILDNVFNKNALSEAKSVDPTMTLDTWKQLEDSFYFSPQPTTAGGRKLPRFGSRRSAPENEPNKTKISDCQITKPLIKFADNQEKVATVTDSVENAWAQQNNGPKTTDASDVQFYESKNGKNLGMSTSPETHTVQNQLKAKPFPNHCRNVSSVHENLETFRAPSATAAPMLIHNCSALSPNPPKHEIFSQLPKNDRPDLSRILSTKKCTFGASQQHISRQGRTSYQTPKNSLMQSRENTEPKVPSQLAPPLSQAFCEERSKNSNQKVGKENRPPVLRSLKDYLLPRLPRN